MNKPLILFLPAPRFFLLPHLSALAFTPALRLPSCPIELILVLRTHYFSLSLTPAVPWCCYGVAAGHVYLMESHAP